LDSNLLIALGVQDHVHHQTAEEWMARREDGFATCPITQGALLRLVLRHGATAHQAMEVLTSVVDHHRHQFWPDDLGFADVNLAGVIGHRQVTDAYLAALARRYGSRLVTFDAGLASLHADVTELLNAREQQPPTSG
jgi:toxin-antitoxin system PIN domain toxin